MCTDFSNQSHGPFPVGFAPAFLIRPFDGVIPDIAKVIPDGKVFRIYFNVVEPLRESTCFALLKCNTRYAMGMEDFKAFLLVEGTPQREKSSLPTDRENTLAAIFGGE